MAMHPHGAAMDDPFHLTPLSGLQHMACPFDIGVVVCLGRQTLLAVGSGDVKHQVHALDCPINRVRIRQIHPEIPLIRAFMVHLCISSVISVEPTCPYPTLTPARYIQWLIPDKIIVCRISA
jgi:hypothetical protein